MSRVELTLPQTDVQAAQAAYTAARNELREKERRVQAMRLALALSASGDDTRRLSPELLAAAKPYKAEAVRRPARLAEQIADLEEECEALGQNLIAARDALVSARSTAANRVAAELEPRHRAAVDKLVAAAEAMSAAIAAERAVRDEYAAASPLPTNVRLPDLSSPLGLGTLAEPNSVLRRWAHELRVRGYVR